MSTYHKTIQTIFEYMVYVLIFTFPLFFLPITRDFLIYSKFYFLAGIVFAIAFISFLKFLLSKKFVWVHNIATQSLILIMLSYILSILLMSPNKIQALYNPQYGLVMVFMMIIMYMYSSHIFMKSKLPPVYVVSVSGLFVALFSIVMMLDPFANATLPSYWSFLTNTTFNTVGSSIHLIAFLVFVFVGAVFYMWRSYNLTKKITNVNRTAIITLGGVAVFVLLALFFHLFIVSQQLLTTDVKVILPPFDLSWYAAVEVLKNPLTGLFGVGVDNFGSLFTLVRTVQYNLSDIWQISSFNSSRSTFLHILTELGILGIVGYGLLISVFLKHIRSVHLESAGMFAVSLVTMILFPPTLITFFMFFLSLAMMSAEIARKKEREEFVIDLSSLTPLFIGMIVIIGLVLGTSGYFIGNHFLGEYYFKKSIDAASRNSLKDLYEYQVKALSFNSANEEFHKQYAQTNILIANNIAASVKDATGISPENKKAISDAVQAAINEAKIATLRNPQKATNWITLANVYRQILNAAQNAPAWTVSAYQQAISLDPRNPVTRLDLGGVFYLFENYDEAQKLFEQAVALKPDWPNAHYNLAWTYYKKGAYEQAVDQMQVVVGLLDPAQNEEDYKVAQKNLDEFKKTYEEELAKSKQSAVEQADRPTIQAPKELNLPTPPVTELEEKIELGEEASPSADLP